MIAKIAPSSRATDSPSLKAIDGATELGKDVTIDVTVAIEKHLQRFSDR